MLCHLLNDENDCVSKVRESESEVRAILKERIEEEARSELEISVYDTERNERAKKHRRELVSSCVLLIRTSSMILVGFYYNSTSLCLSGEAADGGEDEERGDGC